MPIYCTVYLYVLYRSLQRKTILDPPVFCDLTHFRIGKHENNEKRLSIFFLNSFANPNLVVRYL
jgi:hypothetical protein